MMPASHCMVCLHGCSVGNEWFVSTPEVFKVANSHNYKCWDDKEVEKPDKGSTRLRGRRFSIPAKNMLNMAKTGEKARGISVGASGREQTTVKLVCITEDGASWVKSSSKPRQSRPAVEDHANLNLWDDEEDAEVEEPVKLSNWMPLISGNPSAK
eukprot:2253921-Amphidinium_carterae.1